MRATTWVAVSGFLLASGPAYAASGRPSGQGDAVRPDDIAEASQPSRAGAMGDAGPAIADPVAQGSARLSRMEEADAHPRDAEQRSNLKPAAPSNAVTVDPAHPGGEFPWGG